MAGPDAAPTHAQPAHHAALDSAPMGPRQYWIWLLASGGTLLDGFSIFSLGVAMPLVTEHFTLSPLMVGLIGSALVLGAAFGAALGGPMADRFGRKPAFLVDMAIVAAGALISAAADTPFWLLARSVPGGDRDRHRFSRQRVLRVRDHAQAHAQPDGGGDHRAAVGRAAPRRGGRHPHAAAMAEPRRLEIAPWRDRRRRRRVPAAETVASGKSALAHGARPRAGGGAHRRRPRGRPAAARTHVPTCRNDRRHAAGQPIRPALFAALSHANDAGVGAVVSDGHRNLRRRLVHPRHPRRHSPLVCGDRALGRRLRRRRRQRRHRPLSIHRLPHRTVGGAALRPHPHAGRRVCRHDAGHADLAVRGAGRRRRGRARGARVRRLHPVQSGDECRTERDDVCIGAGTVPDQRPRFRLRLCGGHRQGRRDARHFRAAAGQGALGRRGGACHDGCGRCARRGRHGDPRQQGPRDPGGARPRFGKRASAHHWPARSLRLDVGRPDHLAPFLGFCGDELAEVCG